MDEGIVHNLRDDREAIAVEVHPQRPAFDFRGRNSLQTAGRCTGNLKRIVAEGVDELTIGLDSIVFVNARDLHVGFGKVVAVQSGSRNFLGPGTSRRVAELPKLPFVAVEGMLQEVLAQRHV